MNIENSDNIRNSINILLDFLSFNKDEILQKHPDLNDFELLEYLADALKIRKNIFLDHEKEIETEIDSIQQVLFSYSQKDFSKKLNISEEHSNLDALKLTINIQGEELEDLFDELENKQLVEAQNKEKELLLKEIHHRVKNNLQVITSLLGLQSNQIDNDEVKTIFQTSQHRINSIAMVHELLYQSEDLSRTNCKDYFDKLINSLFHSFKGKQHNFNVNIRTSDIILTIDTAIPLGLIINEIITNSLKYGLVDKGSIYLLLTKNINNKYCLKIGDDGPGFSEDINHKTTKSLGLKIISKLVIQLEGSISRDLTKKGTHYIINFKEIH